MSAEFAERLERTAQQLQATIDRIYAMARDGDPWLEPGSDPHALLDPNGRPLLTEPLAALGQVTAALAQLAAVEQLRESINALSLVEVKIAGENLVAALGECDRRRGR